MTEKRLVCYLTDDNLSYLASTSFDRNFRLVFVEGKMLLIAFFHIQHGVGSIL